MYQITENRYDFNVDDIFVVGKRNNNAKRSFLFISKLLGKHLSVNPEVVKASGFLLSSLKYGFDNDQYIDCIKNNVAPDYNKCAEDENILVIGFCETATGLGMAVASSIKGCTYQTTTREKIKNMKKILTFEEAHSHATTHNMFSDLVSFDKYDKVILVDDEITTGNSLLNLMRQIENVHHMKEYNIMTILDWRNQEQRDNFVAFADENQTSVNVYFLISGTINGTDTTIYENKKVKEIADFSEPSHLDVFKRMSIATQDCGITNYVSNSGRFGVYYNDIEKIEKYSEEIANKLLIQDENKEIKSVLVLGHGESIYIPSRIAASLQKRGLRVRFKTTSLSPIYCDGEIIHNVVSFLDKGMRYHYYNNDEFMDYDKVIMFLDTGRVPKLGNNFEVYYI